MSNSNNLGDFNITWKRDIHKFILHGKRILLDVNSGSVHVVDKTAWDVLDALETNHGNYVLAAEDLKGTYNSGEIAEVIEELRILHNQRLLFTSDKQVEAWTRQRREHVVKSLCLNVAHDCNMRCGYCFAADVSFGGKPQLMSFEVGQKAIDFLLKQSGSRSHLEIDYFGGEPLLNLDVVRMLTRYGSKRAAELGKKIRFTVTTNCWLIKEEFIRFVNEYDVQVVLSLDGRKHVHDRVRRLVGGGETYNSILPKMIKLAESRNHGNYYVRGTFTHKNMDFSQDVIHLFDLGFKHVSLEPVVASPDTYGFSEQDMDVLEKEYEKLAQELFNRHKNGQFIDFFHFNVDLRGGVCIPKRIKGCGAGFEYLAVSPDGTVFPCHQFIGRNEFAMGNVGSDINDKISDTFAAAHIYNKSACKDCWARFLCSGGCHANAYEFSGTLLEPYLISCQLQKKRLECAIWFQIEKHLSNL